MVSTVALKSVHGKFLSAQPDGRAEWNRDIEAEWEYFHLEKRQGGKIALKGAHGMYVSAQPDGRVQINRREAPPGGWEEFTVEDRGNDIVCLKSCHGKYLSAQQNGTAQWNRDHAPRGGWEDIQLIHHGALAQPERVQPQRQESVEILEAVSSKPVRFKINNPPSSIDAWVGIYPAGAPDQDHGEQNKRWKWLRDIDANNASFPEQSEGDWSIRIFSDGGYTLRKRKDFQVKVQTVVSQPLDETAEKSRRRGIWIAALFGIFLMLPGLPLLIIGSMGEENLGMIIPGAILTGLGSLALISLLMVWGGTRGRKHDGSQKSSIDILEATTNKGVYFRINNPPSSNDAWVGIYPRGSEDTDHGEEGVRWHWLRDIDVNKARFYEKSEGRWSIRVFSDSGFTLDSQDDFEIIPISDQWWKD